MKDRIERAWNEVIKHRAAMMTAAAVIEQAEENAKMENREEWANAKNNDVRKTIVLRELAGDPTYQAARVKYKDERNMYKLEMLEVERLRMLISAGFVQEL